MRIRRVVIGGALIFLGLPALLTLLTIVTIRVLDQTNGSLLTSGRVRTYLVHVPPSYDRTRPTPLVISMHGAAGWPAQQQNLSRWNKVADEKGFIVAYPAGSGVPKIWHVFHEAGLARDVTFISAMIDTIERTYNIDSTRIYANGISNGGGMAFVLSCTMSNRIAAIGLVSAAQTLPWSWCTESRPIPMIDFHGTADPIIPFKGGHSSMAPETFPDVQTWVSNWAQRDRCASTPKDSALTTNVTRREYTGCADSADVVLYMIQGGGHTWPGRQPGTKVLGRASMNVSANDLIWEFFNRHPMG